MPRTRRLLLEDFLYHITCRGSQKQVIFHGKDDYSRYLSILLKYKSRFSVQIYCYCLMPNHVHLVVKPSQSDDLKRFMHGVNLSYAQYYNFKYEKCGHLWQNRYMSFIVSKDQYLINLISYVEYNPVKAEISIRPEDYNWSSYRARMFGETDRVVDILER